MRRWQVIQHSYPVGNIWAPWKKVWKVYNPRGSVAAHFPTWREAMDYADRMARTREYVLPRIAPVGELTVSAIWSYDSPVVHYIDASGQTVQGTSADLRPLACALLALAEQEAIS